MAERDLYKEERDMLARGRKLNECGMASFGTVDGSEKTIVMQGDTWWQQTAKQEWPETYSRFLWG